MPKLPKRTQPYIRVTEIRTDHHRQVWLRSIEPDRWICLHRGSKVSVAIGDTVGPKRGYMVHRIRVKKLLIPLAKKVPAVF